MTPPEPTSAPVGVRQVVRAAGDDGAGFTIGRLRWVQPGPFPLHLGDRVAVQEGDDEWPGEVIVPADQVLEWPALTSLPVVARRLTDAEWPAPRRTDGRRLLDSLELAPALLARGGSGALAPGPLVGGASPGPRETAEDERGD